MSIRILLVSRDDLLHENTATSCPDAGCDAVRFERVSMPSEAIERLAKHDDIQAVVLDLGTHGGRGAELILELTNIAPHLPILILGDDSVASQFVPMVEKGAQDYLPRRPLDVTSLDRAVRIAIARSTREAKLHRAMERAQVTLHSMGDAVLSTDPRGFITYLNPVAERMMGWSFAEANGRHLLEVFQVIDATTRERLVPSMELGVKSGRTMILPPNCVLVRRDGRESPIEDSAAPIYDRSDRIAGMVVVFHDVSESRAIAQRMTHLAEHDVLTSLPNRVLLADRFEQSMTLARRHKRRLAVLFIDLDHFKDINDSLGHLMGDRLLKAVSQRITPCVRSSDTVSRPGGDEFIVLLSEINRAEDAAIIAEKIRIALNAPYSIDTQDLHLSASIGISVYPDDGDDAERLIQRADAAMYHAKESGRDNVLFYNPDMNVLAA